MYVGDTPKGTRPPWQQHQGQLAASTVAVAPPPKPFSEEEIQERKRLLSQFAAKKGTGKRQ